MPNIERLQKLADHAMTGVLGHKVFDFSQYNNSKGPRCGTNGCAIGECPVVFPEEWRFSSRGLPRLIGQLSADGSARKFFGLSDMDYCRLFIPIEIGWEGSILSRTATRYEVGQNILEFIKENS